MASNVKQIKHSNIVVQRSLVITIAANVFEYCMALCHSMTAEDSDANRILTVVISEMYAPGCRLCWQHS